MSEVAKNDIVVYPNPVVDVVTIANNNLISSIEVFNLLGQKVMSSTPEVMTATMDMSALPVGTYLLQIQSAGETEMIKVVKK